MSAARAAAADQRAADEQAAAERHVALPHGTIGTCPKRRKRMLASGKRPRRVALERQLAAARADERIVRRRAVGPPPGLESYQQRSKSS